jgi:hypothetical protein
VISAGPGYLEGSEAQPGACVDGGLQSDVRSGIPGRPTVVGVIGELEQKERPNDWGNGYAGIAAHFDLPTDSPSAPSGLHAGQQVGQ